MNEEEKKVIKFLKDLITWDEDLCPNKRECDQFEIILNLIERLQKENDQKSKVINLMSKELNKAYFDSDDIHEQKKIMQYFENKVKEV